MSADDPTLDLPGPIEPVMPSPSVRARLMQTLDSVERFAPFFPALAALFELPIDDVRRHLSRIDGPDWETSLLGVELVGAELFHFQVGPTLAAAGAAAGVLRLRAGGHFPRHRHLGREVTFILEGGYVEGHHVLGPGSVIEMPGDSAHDYQAAEGRDLVMAVLHHGVSLQG